MKILVVSDSHGRNTNLIEIVKKVSPIDMMIHLGDFCGTATAIENMVKCPVHMVAGNNDYSSTYPREKVITIGKHRIFMTHGHLYGVKSGRENLIAHAKKALPDVDFVLYGHTHLPENRYIPAESEGEKPIYLIKNILKSQIIVEID